MFTPSVFRTTPPALLVAALLAWPHVASAQQPQVSSDRPFSFAPQVLRSFTSPDRLRAWTAAVNRHEPGAIDASAHLIANWTAPFGNPFAEVFAAVQFFQKNLADCRFPEKARALRKPLLWWDGTLDQLQDVLGLTSIEVHQGDMSRIIARGILLHTDIAMFSSNAMARDDQSAVLNVAALHFGVALALVELLQRDEAHARDPVLDDWYLAIAAFLTLRHDVLSGPRLLRLALARYPGDTDLLLLAGTLREFLASPRVQDPMGLKDEPLFKSTWFADESIYLRQAETFYRQALAREPDLIEARVRLGRVLGRQGRHADALRELTRATGKTAEPRLRYYAWLFTGEERAALGQDLAAGDAYRLALDLFPGAQSAQMALSDLARRRDDRSGAMAAVRDVLTAMDADAVYDPWQNYYASEPGRRTDGLLARFRRRFESGGLQ
jgi:tetratricopeptide (TPR) repeat protein